jgi:hypothetical protein
LDSAAHVGGEQQAWDGFGSGLAMPHSYGEEPERLGLRQVDLGITATEVVTHSGLGLDLSAITTRDLRDHDLIRWLASWELPELKPIELRDLLASRDRW